MKKKNIDLEKENIKYKKIINILIIVIIIGILGVTLVGCSYLFRRKGILNGILNGIVEYKYSLRVKYEDIDEENKENYHNSRYRLNIESPYGDNQGTHPKVLSFDSKWNGYKYWMVYSPYAYSDDYRENPVIKVSNDKVNWIDPSGINNPIVDTPDNYVKSVVYNSDPHLVYNNDKNILECYYRYVNDNDDEVIIYRLTSSDGVNWSDKEELIKKTRTKQDYVSPSIIYEDGIYKMWYVNKSKIYYNETSDFKKFSEDRVISIVYPNKEMKTWHLDVIKSDLGYEMISVGMYNFDDRSNMSLFYSRSDNNEEWSDFVSIIKPSNNGWDNSGIYRSSFIKEDGVYYVYYSGISRDNAKGIGLSYGRDINNLCGIIEVESEE